YATGRMAGYIAAGAASGLIVGPSLGFDHPLEQMAAGGAAGLITGWFGAAASQSTTLAKFMPKTWVGRLALSEAISVGAPNAVSVLSGNGGLSWQEDAALAVAGLAYPAGAAVKGAGMIRAAGSSALLWGQTNAVVTAAMNGSNFIAPEEKVTGTQGAINIAKSFGWSALYGAGFGAAMSGAGGVVGRYLRLEQFINGQAKFSSLSPAMQAGLIVGFPLAGAGANAGYAYWKGEDYKDAALRGAALGLAGLIFLRYGGAYNAAGATKNPLARKAFVIGEAIATGALAKAGYEGYFNGETSKGQITANLIRGAFMGALGLALLKGSKNTDVLKGFYDDTSTLYSQSAKGALNWTLVSPSFMVGGAAFKGVLTKIELAVDGDKSRFA